MDNGDPGTNSRNIDKTEIDRFIAENFTLNIGPTWRETIEKVYEQPYFQEVCRELIQYKEEGKSIVPDLELIWAWTKCCELKDAKVFLVLQDPTTDRGFINTGKALAVRPRDTASFAIPQSLEVIFKTLNISNPDPRNGPLLQGWQDQGVVLLNAIPTLIDGKGWTQEESPFTSIWNNWLCVMSEILNRVLNDDKQENKQVLMLFGKLAKAVGRSLNVPPQVCYIGTCHPSFLNRPKSRTQEYDYVEPDFCKALMRCNEYLGEEAIVWNKVYENGGTVPNRGPSLSGQ